MLAVINIQASKYLHTNVHQQKVYSIHVHGSVLIYINRISLTLYTENTAEDCMLGPLVEFSSLSRVYTEP